MGLCVRTVNVVLIRWGIILFCVHSCHRRGGCVNSNLIYAAKCHRRALCIARNENVILCARLLFRKFEHVHSVR